MRTHTEEKPYSCQHCEKASTIRSALTRHALKAHNVITSIWTKIININFDIHLWKLNVILIFNYDLEGLWILGSPASWKEGVRFPFISVNLFRMSNISPKILVCILSHRGLMEDLSAWSFNSWEQVKNTIQTSPGAGQTWQLNLNMLTTEYLILSA